MGIDCLQVFRPNSLYHVKRVSCDTTPINRGRCWSGLECGHMRGDPGVLGCGTRAPGGENPFRQWSLDLKNRSTHQWICPAETGVETAKDVETPRPQCPISFIVRRKMDPDRRIVVMYYRGHSLFRFSLPNDVRFQCEPSAPKHGLVSLC